MAEPPNESTDPVEAAFAEFHQAWFEGNRLDPEAFCRSHPEAGAKLRAKIETFLMVVGGFPDDGPDGESAAAEGEPEERIGPFRILEELGRGGQGVVYLAEDSRLRRNVALKVLSSRFGLSQYQLQRFRREAESASRLNHPGICSVYETGESKGIPYIAMQHVEGESLAKKIARARQDPSRFKGGAFDTTELVKVPSKTEKDTTSTGSGFVKPDAVHASVYCIERVARAVHAAHESGIIHRDLKPGNILITPVGEPVVLDFGLARIEDSDGPSLTQSTDLFGTPSYMAPEQIRGDRKKIGRSTDVYALAATLYESLALTPPFESPTRDGLYRAILADEPPDLRKRNPRIPSDLSVVIQTALAKDPDHRFHTALDFAEELRRVRQHEPIITRRAGPMLRLLRWAQRNPRLAAAVGGIFFVLTIGLFVSTYLLGTTSSALDEKERFSDIRMLPYLELQAEEALWPALPHMVEDMNLWLEEAKALYDRLDERQRDLETLKGESALHANSAAQREIDMLATFVEKLSLLDMLIEEVEERRDFAATVMEKTVDEFREEWNRTITAIADQGENPHYQGLKLEPRIGLIPLGQDPDSKLFEFAHLRTGEFPMRDPVTSELKITEDTGLVFVLLPGRIFRMGAMKPDDDHPEGTPNVDPDCIPLFTSPVHEVDLDPFFMSKYEMTQGQWFRATGEIPSEYFPGRSIGTAESGVTLRNPVEMVSWYDCKRTLSRLGLVLPTEAQWEYACRAGTTSIWYSGNDPSSLIGYENLADAGSKHMYNKEKPFEKWLSDGYVMHAPVGSYLANPFGLHDMVGNISEWCRERWINYYDPTWDYFFAVSPGDGFREAPCYFYHSLHTCRGGNHEKLASLGRSANRPAYLPHTSNQRIGVRPAISCRQIFTGKEQEKRIRSNHIQKSRPIIAMAQGFLNQGRLPQAERLYRQCLADSRRILGEEHPLIVCIMERLGKVLLDQGEYFESEMLCSQCMEKSVRILGEDHMMSQMSKKMLAGALIHQGKYSEAEPLLRQVLEIQARLYGNEHIQVIDAKKNLANTLFRQGRYLEADPFFRDAMGSIADLLGEEDQQTLTIKILLAAVMVARDQLSEAESFIRMTLNVCRRKLGGENWLTLDATSVLADLRRMQGEPARAETLYRKVMEVKRRKGGSDDLDTIRTIINLAQALLDQEKLIEAETLLKEAINLMERTWPEAILDRATLLKHYGRCLMMQSRFEEAESHLKNSYEGFRTTLGDEHDFTKDAREMLIELYGSWGKPEKAALF